MLKLFAALSSTLKLFYQNLSITKIFSDLYLAKFLDSSAKLFFPKTNNCAICRIFVPLHIMAMLQ